MMSADEQLKEATMDRFEKIEELGDLMAFLSDKYYSAGWMMDWEFKLWACVGPGYTLPIDGAERRKLVALSDWVDGWCMMGADGNPEFVSMNLWQLLFAEWQEDEAG